MKIEIMVAEDRTRLADPVRQVYLRLFGQTVVTGPRPVC